MLYGGFSTTKPPGKMRLDQNEHNPTAVSQWHQYLGPLVCGFLIYLRTNSGLLEGEFEHATTFWASGFRLQLFLAGLMTFDDSIYATL